MTARPDRKRKGSPEWIRLGELLARRRGELDARYDGHGGRAAFAEDTGVNLRLVQDLENNTRENFTPVNLRDVAEAAYKVTYESVLDVLNEDGDLVAEPGTPAHRPPRSRRPAAEVPAVDPAEAAEAAFGAVGVARARPHATEIFLRLRDLAAEGITKPTGQQMFGGASRDARSWDLHAEEMPAEELVWLIAALRARETNPGQGRGSSPNPG